MSLNPWCLTKYSIKSIARKRWRKPVPIWYRASQVVLVVRNPPADAGDEGSIPGSGRSPGVGNGNPLQNSCLENSMGRGAWGATIHGVAECQTRRSTQHTCLLQVVRVT